MVHTRLWMAECSRRDSILVSSRLVEFSENDSFCGSTVSGVEVAPGYSG